jgi:AcrR family transcriptional regulator
VTFTEHITRQRAKSMATKSETHERILLKAAKLLPRFGPRKAAVADIAHELEMTPANIYKFFLSKRALIEAVAERRLMTLRQDLDRAAAVGGSHRGPPSIGHRPTGMADFTRAGPGEAGTGRIRPHYVSPTDAAFCMGRARQTADTAPVLGDDENVMRRSPTVGL